MRTELPCLPLIQERFWHVIKDELRDEEKKYYPEFEMNMFLQTWVIRHEDLVVLVDKQ